MNRIIDKPHFIFLLSIPIIMLIGFLSGDATLNINVHDTYYVIAYIHLTMLISAFFGIIGFGYWMMQKANRKLSRWLNWVHIVLTFGGTFVVLILAQLYKDDFTEYKFNIYLSSVIMLIILIMTLGQVIFPINIIYGLKKGKLN